MSQPRGSLIQLRFENLARHRRLLNAAAPKVPHMSPHAPHSEHAIVIADVSQPWVGVIQNANAIDFEALLRESLGDVNWKVAPASNQSDFLTGGRFLLSTRCVLQNLNHAT